MIIGDEISDIPTSRVSDSLTLLEKMIGSVHDLRSFGGDGKCRVPVDAGLEIGFLIT